MNQRDKYIFFNLAFQSRLISIQSRSYLTYVFSYPTHYLVERGGASVTLSTRIWEMLGSNLGRESCKCQDSTLIKPRPRL
jgi:hypothetical protein